MGSEKINKKFEDRAYQIATGTFLTECFTKEELADISVSDYITEAFEYTNEEMLEALIIDLANEIYLELVKAVLSIN